MKSLNLAILALAIACSEASTKPDGVELEGPYTLQSINGKGLPYQSMAPWSCPPAPFGCAGPHTIRSMVITVRADGTWSAAYDWSRWTLQNGVETYLSTPDGSMSGEWTRWERDLVFRSASLDDDFLVGTVAGSTMVLEQNLVLTRTPSR